MRHRKDVIPLDQKGKSHSAKPGYDPSSEEVFANPFFNFVPQDSENVFDAVSGFKENVNEAIHEGDVIGFEKFGQDALEGVENAYHEVFGGFKNLVESAIGESGTLLGDLAGGFFGSLGVWGTVILVIVVVIVFIAVIKLIF